MYSGTTLTPFSGRALGAHQKIDRLARTALRKLAPAARSFPTAKAILHFEGNRGPDAIKRKSPAKDEPWHFYAPFDTDDKRLLNSISDHYDQLVKALKAHNEVRTAFEAAWLAHAIVDGLTPAHHYPYEAELSTIRGGEGNQSRNTIKNKLLMPGETRRDQVRNNWLMWGPRGLLTTHGMFEWGIAGIIAPIGSRNKRLRIDQAVVDELYKHGVLELFRRKAKEVAALDMYERYQRFGWTPVLARQIRRQLLPVVVHTVTLAWYAALIDAGLVEKRS